MAEKPPTGMFHAALDQFGPHSRATNPMQVQSAFNFDRGGDIDEIRIYDRMLSDENVASLERGQIPQNLPSATRSLNASTSELSSSWGLFVVKSYTRRAHRG